MIGKQIFLKKQALLLCLDGYLEVFSKKKSCYNILKKQVLNTL